MGKIMYKDQDYTGGGEMPEVYDELTKMLDNGNIEFNSDEYVPKTNAQATATLYESELNSMLPLSSIFVSSSYTSGISPPPV